MCGILAVLNFDSKPLDHDLLIRMRDTMFHRGPDDAGLYIEDSVALGHRRLSIIDITPAGHQPMCNEDGSIWLVYNGEIYNYLELRRDLEQKGHKFSSNTDSEVIIHSYEEEGTKCLQKFNGMFAFVLWDRNKQEIFAARDRFGIKPLYFYTDGKLTIFASEIKAILAYPDVAREPNEQGIADYLFCGRPLEGKTFFKNVQEIEPGHFIKLGKASTSFSPVRYWDVNFAYQNSRSDDSVVQELFELLDDAVRIHCRSDARLGCHLSGGLDSSTVVAFAARHRQHLETFSTKFIGDSRLDETPYAREVATHVGAVYRETKASPDELSALLPFLVWHMDMPMATNGGFSYYTVSNLAKDTVKVSLTGHGGDELFAGYPAQFQAAFHTTDMFDLRLNDLWAGRRGSGNRLLHWPFATKTLDLLRLVRNKFRKRPQNLEDLWIMLHCNTMPNKNPILEQDFLKRLEGYSPREGYVKPLREAQTDSVLDKCLYHDLIAYLPGLLHLEDRVSMAVSMESRVPLLDYRIAEYLATVPPEQKVRMRRPKYLLRQVAAKLLPSIISNRPDKMPFPIPPSFWQTDSMRQLVSQLLLSSDCQGRGIFRRKALRDAITSNNINALWHFINVELWFKIFIDRDNLWVQAVATKRLGDNEPRLTA